MNATNPFHNMLVMIDNDINHINLSIDLNRQERLCLLRMLAERYSALLPDWSSGLVNWNGSDFDYACMSDFFLQSNLCTIRSKLLAFQSSLSLECSTFNPFSVWQNYHCRANQAGACFSFDEARKVLAFLPTLSEEELDIAFEKLNIMECLAKSCIDPLEQWEELQPIVAWISTQPYAVATTFFPLLLKF